MCAWKEYEQTIVCPLVVVPDAPLPATLHAVR